MQHVLILIRIRTNEFENTPIEGYFMGVREALNTVPGFLGGGLWRTMGEPQETLILYVYESLEASREGLKAIAERVTVAETSRASMSTADARVFNITFSHGALRRSVGSANYLSLGVRIADPGHGEDLRQEIEDILGGLQYLPGYDGGMIAVHNSIEEEIASLAAWKSASAFMTSLPERMPYDLAFYQRIL